MSDEEPFIPGYSKLVCAKCTYGLMIGVQSCTQCGTVFPEPTPPWTGIPPYMEQQIGKTRLCDRRQRQKPEYKNRPLPPGADARWEAPKPQGSAGPAGQYSGWVCMICTAPLPVGASGCPSCGVAFPSVTLMHPAQAAAPRDDRPSHVYDPLSSRYVPRVQHEKQQEQFGGFVLIASVILVVLALLFVFGSHIR